MLELYKPALQDLWFKETMLSDAQTMSYNHAYGGIVPFPKENWASWYDRWLMDPHGKRFYRYVKENQTFIAEVAYHFDEERQIYLTDVIVYAPYRGKGYGQTALALLCAAAKENGIKELYDDIAADNPSVALFLKCGFREVSRTDECVLVRKDFEKDEMSY